MRRGSSATSWQAGAGREKGGLKPASRAGGSVGFFGVGVDRRSRSRPRIERPIRSATPRQRLRATGASSRRCPREIATSLERARRATVRSCCKHSHALSTSGIEGDRMMKARRSVTLCTSAEASVVVGPALDRHGVAELGEWDRGRRYEASRPKRYGTMGWRDGQVTGTPWVSPGHALPPSFSRHGNEPPQERELCTQRIVSTRSGSGDRSRDHRCVEIVSRALLFLSLKDASTGMGV